MLTFTKYILIGSENKFKELLLCDIKSEINSRITMYHLLSKYYEQILQL